MSVTPAAYDQLWELMSAASVDEATDGDIAQLNARLQGDADACRTYAQFSRMHAGLFYQANVMEARRNVVSFLHGLMGEAVETGAGGAAAASAVHSPVVERWLARLFRFRDHQLRTSLTAAAIIVAVACLIFYIVPMRNAAPQPAGLPHFAEIARLTGTHACRWSEAATAYREGDWLPAGSQLEVAAGLAEVSFRDNAIVTVDSASTFSVIGEREGLLAVGKLTAFVKPSAADFTISTPTAKVVASKNALRQGTEFGVVVRPDQSVGFDVFHGQVNVIATQGKSQFSLQAGEALTTNAAGTEVSLIGANAENFTRRLPNRGAQVLRPHFVPGENILRVKSHLQGAMHTDGNLNNYDDGTNASHERNQYVWVDFSETLARIENLDVLSAKVVWRGRVKTQCDFTHILSCSTRLGMFPVPGEGYGHAEVFTRLDGNDNVRFFESHARQLLTAANLPQFESDRTHVFEWDFMPVLRHWRENPQEANRGQVIVVNEQLPIWVEWQPHLPRIVLQLSHAQPSETETGEDRPAALQANENRAEARLENIANIRAGRAARDN